jgi:hypothetical protein
MTDTNAKTDLLNWEEPKKLPDMLNVLTILTFVGSGLFACSALYSFLNAQKSYDNIIKMQDKLDDAPAIVKKFMGPDMIELARKSVENRTPILLLTLIAYGLCTYGAIQMRKLKKTGFSIYVLGELLPLVTGLIFIGTTSVGGFAYIFTVLILAIFIILYATQLKHMS